MKTENTSGAESILILGGNPETAEIVRVANSLGLRTIVINPFENSPAKREASAQYNFDPSHMELLDQIVEKESIRGVLLGVSDPLLPTYHEICNRYNFPCYVNEKSLKAFSSKSEFAGICTKFDIKPVPQYQIANSPEVVIQELLYPVVVKPVDSGAAV